MVSVLVFVADPDSLSAVAETAVRHARAAAGRFAGQATVEVLSLASPEALTSGIGLEPTVLVGDLVVSVGQAPAAGHLVRALQSALSKETPQDA